MKSKPMCSPPKQEARRPPTLLHGTLCREVVVACFAANGQWPETWRLLAGDVEPAPDVVAEARTARATLLRELEAG